MGIVQVNQESRMLVFEDACALWMERRLTQSEAARLLGVCDGTFRRQVERCESDGIEGLRDRGCLGRRAGRRREPSPWPGVLLRQDGGAHEWVQGTVWDLIVAMDDATNEHYSMFFCEDEGTMSGFLGVREVVEPEGFFLLAAHGSRLALLARAGGGREGGQGEPDPVRAGDGAAGRGDGPGVFTGGPEPGSENRTAYLF